MIHCEGHDEHVSQQAIAQILATLKKADATAVTIEDACQVTEKFAETVLNGDGIIDAIDDFKSGRMGTVPAITT